MQATSRGARRKLVVVGDGACGKTSLLIAFAHDEFPETHIPTVFETYATEIKVLTRHRLTRTMIDISVRTSCTGGSRGKSGHAPQFGQSDSLAIKLVKLVPPDDRF